MFNYETSEEAKKMKDRISAALLGVDENVVSVSTRKEEMGDLTVYAVKIGLENASAEVITSIFAQLRKAKIVSDSFNESVYLEQNPSPFITVGTISAKGYKI